MGMPLEHLFAGAHSHQGGSAYHRPPYFRTKKVGLLGSTDSLRFAPWDDPSWTLVAHPCARPRCKREPNWYFDMHRPECFRVEKKQWNPAYYTWLKRLQTPIFMQEEWADIPMAVRYPFERVEAEFASSATGTLFATNHCAFMMALAMMEGVEQIGLWGCQYAGSERGTQRESLIYWIARFEQYGGRIVMPRTYNTLMTQPLYGYASHDERGKLIPEYRALPAVQKPGETLPSRLVEPSLVPLAPLPPGEKVRTREDAFAHA